MFNITTKEEISTLDVEKITAYYLVRYRCEYNHQVLCK